MNVAELAHVKMVLVNMRTAKAQASLLSRKNIGCSLTQYMNLWETTRKEMVIWSDWMVAHARLKDHDTHKMLGSLFSIISVRNAAAQERRVKYKNNTKLY